MAIAYTQKPINYRPARSDTSANLRGDLDAIVQSVGWVPIAFPTNGITYQITSPQLLQAKVTIQDTGGHNFVGQTYIIVQVTGIPSGENGYEHHLLYGLGAPDYIVLAGICQLFVGVAGNVKPSLFDNSSQVALGIPALAQDVKSVCQQLGTKSISELWWSCGDGAFEAFQCANFRTGLYCFTGWSVCLNGALLIPVQAPSSDTSQGMLCLFPFTRTDNVDFIVVFNPSPVILSGTGRVFYSDALVGWNRAIQGQLWDAFLASGNAGTAEAVQSFDDVDASSNPISFSAVTWCAGGQNQTRWGELNLLIGEPVPHGGTGPVNYAY